MLTPWGISTRIIELEPGIAFFMTARHGGVMVSQDYAEKKLSFPAQRRALRFEGYYTYEMDYAWAIPLWELPHLGRNLAENGKAGLDPFPEKYTAAILARSFPDYLSEYWALKSYALCRP